MLGRFRAQARVLGMAAIVLALSLAGTASGHHGFRGAYDATNPFYAAGTVRQVTIAYPHVELVLEVAAAPSIPDELPQIEVLEIPGAREKLRALAPGEYEIQLAGTEFVSALEGRIAAGDPVALIALRNCQPPNEVRSRWIRLADGDIVTVRGATQAEVAGCDNT